MLIIIILISFLGYSLLWRQISFWARIVITNFISIIPIIGNKLIILIWGNHYINNILINRFFSIHFIFAFLLIIISIIHIIILHLNKSNNPLRTNNNLDQINLNPIFIIKDFNWIIILILITILINLIYPIKINNPDNFNPIKIFSTPNHIEPEWYFLFFYSILRSIENKLSGLILIIISIIIWFFYPYINKSKFISNKFLILNKLIISIKIIIISLITFIGSKISKQPYLYLLKQLIIMFILSFIINNQLTKLINKLI